MIEKEMNFDIDVLRTFIESVRERSLAKAAVIRGKSPSTVTLQMQRLEIMLGVKMFARAGRGVLPTEHARKLLPYAEAIVLANDQGMNAAASTGMDQVIRIAVPADLAETWLSPLLSAFMSAHPGTSTETQVLRNSEIIEMIEGSEVDLALHWMPNGMDASVEPIATFPIEWMAARSFSSDPQRALPIVVLQSPCLFRDLGIDELAKAHEPARVAMATTGVTGLWSAVAAGLGVTCRVAVAAPQGVVRYKDPRLPELGTIGLALRTSESAPRSVTILKAYLADAIRSLAR
jgi:DNA-binding transcriptional LysR family regulator